MNGAGLPWNLRTHPFAPEVDAAGKPLDPLVLRQPLDPGQEPRLLEYYYDVYDWTKSPTLGGISGTNVLDRFPTAADLRSGEPLLILVFGNAYTGCTSLVNLILHKIQRHEPVSPLIVDVPLNSLSKAENVKSVARLFSDAYRDAALSNPEFLDSVYRQETREVPADSESYFATMFHRFSGHFRKHGKRPVVLSVSGGEHYDTWQLIYNSTKSLANYIVATTSNEVYADNCRKKMLNANSNIVLIKAKKLTVQDTLHFVRDRLSRQRSAALADDERHALAPFSEAALQLIHAKGSIYDKGANSGKGASAGGGPSSEPVPTVVHPIGWLTKTLHRAFDDYLTDVRKQQGQQGAAAAPDPVMAPDRILESRNALNQGS